MATELPTLAARYVRLRIFLVLLCSFLAMTAAAAISVGYSVHDYWQGVLRDEITRSLTEKTRMFAARVETDRTHRIEDIASQEGQLAGARATVVDVNGKVIADSEATLSSLENEGRRPEFAEAMRGQPGVETRRHNGIPVLYVAAPVSGGAVRLAYPIADVGIATSGARRVLILGSVIATLAAIAISWWASGRIVQTDPTVSVKTTLQS